MLYVVSVCTLLQTLVVQITPSGSSHSLTLTIIVIKMYLCIMHLS